MSNEHCIMLKTSNEFYLWNHVFHEVLEVLSTLLIIFFSVLNVFAILRADGHRSVSQVLSNIVFDKVKLVELYHPICLA